MSPLGESLYTFTHELQVGDHVGGLGLVKSIAPVRLEDGSRLDGSGPWVDVTRVGRQIGTPRRETPTATHDPVNHPAHYTAHPSGVECIQVTEHMNFNLGNAVKYIWRAGIKGAIVEDLEKARWYLDREIQRLKAARP